MVVGGGPQSDYSVFLHPRVGKKVFRWVVVVVHKVIIVSSRVLCVGQDRARQDSTRIGQDGMKFSDGGGWVGGPQSDYSVCPCPFLRP